MGSINSMFTRGGGPPVEEVKNYCQTLIFVKFNGQTSCMEGDSDRACSDHVGNLGQLLAKLDAEVRAAPTPDQFKITDKFLEILKKISQVRYYGKQCETPEHCFNRLLEASKMFATHHYQKRNRLSEVLSEEHSSYWGTRQQLLFGKVVADWIEWNQKKKKIEKYREILEQNQFREQQQPLDHEDEHGMPMDAIFGVLLNPTGGRAGPGDSSWFHDTLFDDFGPIAYHSAVHDGFGYLINNHQTGPGYNYLDQGLFGDTSPMGGQASGILFWDSCLDGCDLQSKQHRFLSY